MEKLKNIEFLRIVGCIVIIMFHLFDILYKNFSNYSLYELMHNLTSNGQKAVDLFFIISGFFFAWKLNLNLTLWEFIKRKLIRLYPVLIFLTVLSAIIAMFGVLHFNLYDNIINILCLSGTGIAFRLSSSTGLFWYVSSMLWVLLLFFFLRKNYDDKTINFLIVLLVFFAYSFILHAKGGQINSHVQTFCYVFNIGFLRAIGGIGLGYLFGEWYKARSNIILQRKITLIPKILLTGLEIYCLFFIINNLMFHKSMYHNHIIYIIMFMLTIVLFVIKKGWISEMLNKDIFVFLAKYTYSFYMSHMLILLVLSETLWKAFPDFVVNHIVLNLIVTFLIIILFGVFTYHFVEKPCAEYKKNL